MSFLLSSVVIGVLLVLLAKVVIGAIALISSKLNQGESSE